MKRLLLIPLLAMLTALGVSAQSDPKQPLVYGVAFYNLENLFDTINNNGSYDLEFSEKLTPMERREILEQNQQSRLLHIAHGD